MNFDLAQLFSLPPLLLGVAVSSLAWFLLDKSAARKVGGGLPFSEDAETVAKLQAELDSTRESQAKVNEVHAYARTLEAKIQQLESVSDSADAELRVKVLEKQLSEKADLEAKLAVAQQQLEDYQAKAEMYDTVVGSAPAPAAEPESAVEPIAEPVVELEPEPELEPEVEPEVEAEPTVVEEAADFDEVIEMAPAAAEAAFEEPAAQLEVEEESIAAVASAETAPGITLVQNEVAAKGPASPIGATAPALDERPALRIESSTDSILEVRDPLEKIDGVGQIYQTKLYEAGIKTFAQLAASSPSRITEVIEPQNWQQIDVMKWRREAALYASGEKS